MERSKLTHEDLLSLRVGDVVRMSRANAPEVTAPIIKVEHRWGTGMLPLLTLNGHDPNWTDGAYGSINFDACLEAGAHMVLEIISKASYRVIQQAKRNIFREQLQRDMARAVANGRTEFWCHARNGAPKGQLRGTYREMTKPFHYALSKLPYEITTALHDERAMELWQKAGYPGLVRRPDVLSEHERQNGRSLSVVLAGNEHWFVREKPFCRFVRQNWSQLVMTKAEMHADADAYYRQMAKDCWDRDEEDDYLEPMDDLKHPFNAMDELHETDTDDWIGSYR